MFNLWLHPRSVNSSTKKIVTLLAYKVTTFVCYLIIPTDNLEYLNK